MLKRIPVPKTLMRQDNIFFKYIFYFFAAWTLKGREFFLDIANRE